VGRENVIAGSDCGFGTWVGQAAVDPDVVWAKFATMAEGTRIASKRWNVGYDALWIRYAHIEKPDKYSFFELSLRKSPARLRKQCAASTLGPGQLSRTDGSNQEAVGKGSFVVKVTCSRPAIGGRPRSAAGGGRRRPVPRMASPGPGCSC